MGQKKDWGSERTKIGDKKSIQFPLTQQILRILKGLAWMSFNVKGEKKFLHESKTIYVWAQCYSILVTLEKNLICPLRHNCFFHSC